MPSPWDAVPDWLNDPAAREFFPDLVAELRDRGRLGQATRYQVGWFCQFLAVFVRATEAVNKRDGLVDEFYGKGEDPAIAMRLPSAEYKVLTNALTQLRRLTKELGLNESASVGTRQEPRERLRSALGQLEAVSHN